MRFSNKGMSAIEGENQLFGVDFHDFIQSEPKNTTFELAAEFGLTIGDVKKLKKQLDRS